MGSKGEIGYIFMLDGTLIELLRTGMLSAPSLISLFENDPPRLVLRAEPILISAIGS